MPEARDRRVIPLDIDALFTNRRPFTVYQDPDLLPAGSDRFVAQRTPFGRGITRPRGLHAPGNENTPQVLARRGRTRAGANRSILPSWYPRTPLRDITAVTRAIERRRSRLGEEEIQQQTGTPISGNQLTVFSDRASFSASGSRAYKNSPKSCIKLKTPQGSKVPKIVIDFANLPQEDPESEFLTPEKKLLNSIDTVEKALAQELMKLKRTPSAKKAEREKRVRTLMSMR
ncbi:unnamed protein product [Trifolium pratense]|uniref:Uncharacterized protein n=1 Tax=Trifolium pratense TaxID=57577 RepID=A0ACB0LPS7_TRIPR|nr:unnamed protein product [Trifolium pratense]